jgi:hypothetical protein
MEDYGSSNGLSSSDLKHGSNIDELRSTVHNMELQLAKSKEEKAMISNKIEELNEHLDKSQKKIIKNEEALHEKTRKIKELEFKVEQATRNIPQGNIDLMSFQHELRLKDEELNDLKALLRKKDGIIEVLKSQSNLEEQKLKYLNNNFYEKSKKTEELESKLQETSKNLDLYAFSKRNEGTLLVELEHYKADNARLVTLLKSTSEFKSFGEYAEASEGIRYLPKSTKAPIKASDECDDWVPSEAWKMVKDFLAKYGTTGFKSVQINKLLEDLNHIWRKREKNLMNQVRSKCNREVEALRRQLANTPKYEQFVTDKEINRLKNDLKRANEDLRVVSSYSVRAVGRPHGFI